MDIIGTHWRSTLEQALDKWGIDAQLLMVSEEFGELLSALSKWRRGRIAPTKVAEEIADVYIMLSQIAIMIKCPQHTIDALIESKLKRLQNKL